MIARNIVLVMSLALLMAVPPASAAEKKPAQKPPTQKELYEKCLSLANLDPAAALSMADGWAHDNKGGAPAVHCTAMALTGLKRYDEAGAKLDALARAPGSGALRSQMFDQAGNAWMLAGQADKAVASFSAALALSGGDTDLYADLARAQALQSNWGEADSDLSAALALSPRRADLLILRSSARLALGSRRAAAADADAAIKLAPASAEAMMQRGVVRRDSGDLKGARADFDAALKRDPRGDTGDAARRNLAALDAVKPTPSPKKK